MVVEMVGFSVKFDTRMDDGIEVITLYYRVNGRLCDCKRFTGVTRSALLDMLRFVCRLKG